METFHVSGQAHLLSVVLFLVLDRLGDHKSTNYEASLYRTILLTFLYSVFSPTVVICASSQLRKGFVNLFKMPTVCCASEPEQMDIFTVGTINTISSRNLYNLRREHMESIRMTAEAPAFFGKVEKNIQERVAIENDIALEDIEDNHPAEESIDLGKLQEAPNFELATVSINSMTSYDSDQSQLS